MSAVEQEVQQQTGTALTLPQRAAVAIRSAEVEAKLVELATASKQIVTITNVAGYQQCHSARMALKRMRIDIEKTGKEARDDAVKFGKAVITEENRLIGIIDPEEQRLKVIQDSWDAEQARIKREREEAEQKRVEGLRARIADIQAIPGKLRVSVPGGGFAFAPVSQIADAIEALTAIEVDEAQFAEFTTAAREAKVAVLEQLYTLQTERLAAEAEAARLEQERKDREVAEAVERARQAEEADRLRKQREAQEAEAKRLADQQAEIDRQREHQEAIACEQQATLAAQRREQEEREAAAQRRQEAEAACNAAIAGINTIVARGVAAETIDLALIAIAELEDLLFSQDDYGEDAQHLRDERDSAHFSINNRIRQLRKIADDEAELEKQRAQLEAARNTPAVPETPVGADSQEAGPGVPAASTLIEALAPVDLTAYPGLETLVDGIADHFSVTTAVAREWLHEAAAEL